MKKNLLFFVLLFSITNSFGQSLKKYPISNSGCSVYNYCDIKYDISKSQDSSTVYAGECSKDEISYGVICVKLLEPVKDLNAAEELLISYADFLKSSFKITKSAGYGKGHRLNNNENTLGIIDYWEDAEKENWKIKAWTDGKFIGFLYAYSKKELPETKINLFLDGFRLP
ncbi:MAG: hypothetical protein WBC06_15250 [Chitinophagaceae bacterium]